MGVEVAVGDADVQRQSEAEVHKGFRQEPLEQIRPDSQLLLLVQELLHAELEVGVGVGVSVGDGLGEANELQTVRSVVQEAPDDGQQY